MIDANNLNIGLLADHVDVIPALVEWFESEWEPYYGPSGPGDADVDLRAAAKRTSLPICLVAFVGDELVGTIALKEASISHPELKPWGAAMLVHTAWRRRGVGGALVEASETLARDQGCSRLYMSTDAANSILKARAWKAIDTAESLRGTITVFELEL
jgi:GNAT superfamily N-acetyltransferase